RPATGRVGQRVFVGEQVWQVGFLFAGNDKLDGGGKLGGQHAVNGGEELTYPEVHVDTGKIDEAVGYVEIDALARNVVIDRHLHLIHQRVGDGTRRKDGRSATVI